MKNETIFPQIFPQGDRLPEEFSRYFTGQAYLASISNNEALGTHISNVTFEPGGWFLPVVFAIATGMPVVIAAWVLAYSAAGVGLFYGRMQIIRKWLARTVGMLFIAVGIYYWIIYFF